jgi:HSP20 family protein
MRSLKRGAFCAVIAAAAAAILCAAPAAAAKTDAEEKAGESMKSAQEPSGLESIPPMGQDIWAELRGMQERLNRVVEDAGYRYQSRAPMWPAGPSYEFYPDADVRETDKAVIVSCDLPGMEKDKIEVSFKDGNLIISGKREVVKEESKSTGWYMRERSFGSFERVIPISDEIKESEIKADYKNGVLTITLPKAEEALKPVRKIQIL